MVKGEIRYVPEETRLEDLPKDQESRVAKLYDVPLGTLIERFSKSQTYGEQGRVLNDDYFDIPIILREILGVCKIRDINDSIESIEKAIENLEAKFRNHRHETGKTFSAKPEY